MRRPIKSSKFWEERLPLNWYVNGSQLCQNKSRIYFFTMKTCAKILNQSWGNCVTHISCVGSDSVYFNTCVLIGSFMTKRIPIGCCCGVWFECGSNHPQKHLKISSHKYFKWFAGFTELRRFYSVYLCILHKLKVIEFNYRQFLFLWCCKWKWKTLSETQLF